MGILTSCSSGGPKAPKTRVVLVIPLGHLPELYNKALLLKIPCALAAR